MGAEKTRSPEKSPAGSRVDRGKGCGTLMAIVAMRHLRLIGLQSEREEMLRRLQHLGCLEITEPAGRGDDHRAGAVRR